MGPMTRQPGTQCATSGPRRWNRSHHALPVRRGGDCASCASRDVRARSTVSPERTRSLHPSMPTTLTPTDLHIGDYEPLRITYGRDILVVDDNQTNLIAIEAALSPLGRKLVLAHSGVEALGRLLEQDFALIILDVAMPGMDGFETARLVRSRARNRATPIIFITGLSWHDDAILKGYELGAFDFLMKPIRPEVLRAKATVFIELQERTFELRDKADQLRAEQARAHERELTMQR